MPDATPPMDKISRAPITIDEHRERMMIFEGDMERLAYVDEGEEGAPVVVLMHGMPTSSWLYRNIIPKLAAAGYRVIAPDMIGFGHSSKPTKFSRLALDLQAIRLESLMDSLKIRQWYQVAHDLGGPWTWELICRRPQSLLGLVVLNTTAYADGFNTPAFAKLAAGPMGPLISFLMGNGITGPGQVKSFFAGLMAKPGTLTSEVVQGHWLPLHEGATRSFLAFAKNLPYMISQFPRYSAALRGLHIPATTIWGGRDVVQDHAKLGPQFAQDLSIPPDWQFTLDTGHFLQEDNPAEVSRLIINFLQYAEMTRRH